MPVESVVQIAPKFMASARIPNADPANKTTGTRSLKLSARNPMPSAAKEVIPAWSGATFSASFD